MIKGVVSAIATSIVFVAASANSAIYYKWAVGQEREVDAGVYAKLVAQRNGWRLWRFETVNGVHCKAIKPAIGRPAPVPLGVNSVMHGGVPRIELYFPNPVTTRSSVEGTYSGGAAQVRAVGDRFWTDADDVDLAEMDGRVVEVVVKSWEYPAVLVGYAEDRGSVSLVGIDEITDSGMRCAEG